MKKCLLTISILSANLFIIGCADDQARQQIADTNQRLNQLQQSVSVVNNKLTNQKTLDLLNQIDSLQNQINQLNGKIAELEQGKSSSGADTQQQIQSLDMRVAALEGSGGGSTANDAKAKMIAPAVAVVETKSSNNDEAKLDAAIAKIKSNKIASATADLKEIISTGGNSASAKEARYYLSIAYVADSKYSNAIDEANKYISVSPKGKNVPDAMRVVYIAQTQMGNNAAAKATASKLLKSYPNSPAAKKVAKQINQ